MTGRQSLVTSGNLLVDPAGLAIAPGGLIYVIENVGTLGQPGVVSVDPATGAQTLVTQGGQLCYPFGIAVHPNGSVLVTDYGDFSRRHDRHQLHPRLRRAREGGPGHEGPVDPVAQRGAVGQPVSQPARSDGGTGRAHPAREPERRDRAGGGEPGDGVQDAETTNSGTDRLVLPQRPALTPDGDVVVSDFTLDDMEGGLVSVDLPDGGQSILRQDRQLFNNPLGVAVVANHEPVAALAVSPGQGRRRPAGELRRVRLARPRGAPAPLRLGSRRQRQLRDGRRHEPDRSRTRTAGPPPSPRACARATRTAPPAWPARRSASTRSAR